MSTTNGAAVNGSSAPTKGAPLQSGLYVPTVAFFNSDDSVDVETTRKHATWLVDAGVAGLVTHGSNGEAVHLDRDERKQITKATREAIDSTSRRGLPLIVGCGAQSTRETTQLCVDAAQVGGTHALILPPSYYGGLLNMGQITSHFQAVADASPIPLVIYNFPAPCGGLDLSSDVILELAKHDNIVGVKLTCGNTGKLARIVAGTKGTSFAVYGGSVDFTIQTLSVGGHGIIGGLGNVAPRTCLEVIKLWKAGKTDAATEVQAVVARGDWAAIKGGFISVKAALNKYRGYGGEPRKPCAFLEGKALQSQLAEFSELVAAEEKLAENSQ